MKNPAHAASHFSEDLLTKIHKATGMIKNAVKKSIHGIVNKLGYEIVRHAPNGHELVSLPSHNGSRGNMLLSYIIEPFLLKPGDPISTAHTHDWESFQIAQTFLDLGYSVDVIDYRNNSFIPQKHFSFFVGARTNFARIARQLNNDCIKIVHLDTAHWVFNNYATYKRSLELQHRKRITLPLMSHRIIEPNFAIEDADYATLLGNRFTISTYEYAQKPIYPIPISTCAMYGSPENKNFETCRNNFLWFGSGGMVHKGLDLLLELFVDMPDYHLYICGPVDNEKDFMLIFFKELFQTPNIHTIGWVDVNSAQFIKILNTCIGLVYPSCAEGQNGGVVNCMHAGLIPIISYQSGVDVHDFGFMLADCSKEEIRETILKISAIPVDQLRSMSLKAWEFAIKNHTRERFTEDYKRAIIKIMENSLRF